MKERLLELGMIVALLPIAVPAFVAVAVLTAIDDHKHPGCEWDSHPCGGWTCPPNCPGCKKVGA